MGFRYRRIGSGLLIVSMSLIVGCAREHVPPPRSEAEENLSKIGQAYMDARTDLKHPPRNASELLPSLLKIGGSEQTLRSPRDAQEYVILWDVKSSDLMPKPMAEGLTPEQRFPVLAYEKTGEGGERLVLQFPNRIVLMTKEELSNAYFPAGHRPPP